ncbi:hypothetical protein C8Q69DRAFT_452331 [Paecilomyces variotii]|uniref:DUF6594 domain-containing protein n=1 Tax=Byssochlamys spectabilis TaxID=264951 RepID=A0A443I6T8_BYSSP|nr:hypothetical protein C8Q69DRAFT_452331 [Paecilomyces variotii]KAJ9364250.1 hypothetical protein DTO280E4_2013 [Paecilomyces variotii]RWQ99767.1 hypothetical protein C8Q69DRAFT_452331 [Paecilomyces variotii]
MSSIDHRYDELIDLFQRCPRTAVFRDFRNLNLVRILQLQATIDEFERSFESPSIGASNGATNTTNPSTSEAHSAKPVLQVDMAQCIWPTLKEYYERMLLDVQIQSLPTPEECDLNYLRLSLKNVAGLTEHEVSLWNHGDDFVALFADPHEEFDRFTRWVFNRLELFHDYVRKFKKVDDTLPVETYAYNRRALASIVTVFSAIMAVLINVSSIYILYYIDSMQTRLGVIMIYTALFALMMMVLTNSGGANIFPATAAYAAVLVVFIGNNNNNNGS